MALGGDLTRRPRRSPPRRCSRCPPPIARPSRGEGYDTWVGREARARISPVGAISSALVLVVPWSMARIAPPSSAARPASRSRAALATPSAVSPCVPSATPPSRWAGSPESPGSASGRGRVATISATAPPRPPRTECSSTVTIAPVAAASTMADSSSGVRVDRLITRASTPSSASASAAASARCTMTPLAMIAMSWPARRISALPISKLGVGAGQRRHRHAADADEHRTVERGGRP
jgi:hypothetical protein